MTRDNDDPPRRDALRTSALGATVIAVGFAAQAAIVAPAPAALLLGGISGTTTLLAVGLAAALAYSTRKNNRGDQEDTR